MGGFSRCVTHTHTCDKSSPSTERCERRASRASDCKAPRWWIVHHSISRDIPGAVSRCCLCRFRVLHVTTAPGLRASPRVDPACQLVNMLCQRRGLDGRFLSVGLMGSYELGCWACGPPPVSTPRVNLSTCCVNVGASMGGSYQLA